MAEVTGSNPAEPTYLFNRKTPERVSIATNKLSTLASNSRQLLAANDGENSGVNTLSDLVLTFTKGELCKYVDARIIGLADRSCDWIVRAAKMLWLNTRGEVSLNSMERVRSTTLTQYSSVWSYAQTLSFVKAFLRYLTKLR